jgi:hypothetical protein
MNGGAAGGKIGSLSLNERTLRMTTGSPRTTSGWAMGLVTFAGALMLMAGVFQAISGAAAIFDDEFYVVTQNYVFDLDASAWGWVHLLLGIVLGMAGWAVFSGAAWGRSIGVVIAMLSAIANFFFIPYYPFWAILIIALDVFVIWALAAHGGELAE